MKYTQDNLSKLNLLDLDETALQAFMHDMGATPYHANKIFKAIHQGGITDIQQIENLGKELTLKLALNSELKFPCISHQQIATDGTIKWLIKLNDNNCVETVYIPEDDRGTLCISSQVGCALNCSFCQTATQGFSRNLSIGEIVGQLWLAVRRLNELKGHTQKHITNVVMMGMGEPLLNFDNVVSAMNIMLNDNAYGLSKYRVTLSTSGLVPMMKKLAFKSSVSLAVSLHATTNELRNQLVPINKKYPLEQLLAVCQNYFKIRNEPKRQIVMEYVMLKDINDSLSQATELALLLKDIPAKVNLIPFNPFPGSIYQTSSSETIRAFQNELLKRSIYSSIRKTRGADIAAACGQLTGLVMRKKREVEL